MPEINRHDLATLIVERLTSNLSTLRAEYATPKRIPTCHIDDLLPETIARPLYAAFPAITEMILKNNLRENKYVAVQMNRYNPLLEEALYAFQDRRVIDAVCEITHIANMFPDQTLYAGGISLMTEGQFLNPHLDNSHDKERQRFRVLNLLYYVSPDWQPEYGGNLELWDEGPKGEARTVHSCFNRLVLMATYRSSWHSVSRVVHQGRRCCLSNYYFSPTSPEPEEYFHVTSFRGRPEEPVKDAILLGDSVLRSAVRKVFKKGVVENPHVYKK